MALNATLTTLDDLCSIFESLAMDFTGEAKHSLWLLSQSLESDPAYRFAGHEDARQVVDGALTTLRAGEKERAAHFLMVLSRRLWDEARG